MRFAFVHNGGASLPWQLQLQDEGHEVRQWDATLKPSEPALRLAIGQGLIEPVATAEALLGWGGRDALYVFDYSGKGELSETWRRQGYRVFGAHPLWDQLERRRMLGMQMAQVLGIAIPRTVEVATLTAARDWLTRHGGDGKWYWKSDDPKLVAESSWSLGGAVEELLGFFDHLATDCEVDPGGILQEALEGVVLDTCGWWDGSRWAGYIGMIEYKKFLAGDLGPNTGAEHSWVWGYEGTPAIATKLRFPALGEYLKRAGVPPGEYGINAIINHRDRKPYLLEWNERMGYDEDNVYLPILDRGLGESLDALSRGSLDRSPLELGTAVLGVRLSLPPYPWTKLRRRTDGALGIHVFPPEDRALTPDYVLMGVARTEGGFVSADPLGVLGLVTAVGTDPAAMAEEAYDVAREIRAPSLQYRADAGRSTIQSDVANLRAWGYACPLGG